MSSNLHLLPDLNSLSLIPTQVFDDDDFQYELFFINKEEAERKREEAADAGAQPAGFLSP